MTDATKGNIAHPVGAELAEVLQLKRKRNGRYETAWGDKSELGLFLTVQSIMDDESLNARADKAFVAKWKETNDKAFALVTGAVTPSSQDSEAVSPKQGD